MESDASTSKSEVARLRWQLERSCEALHRVMYDPGFSASHRAITRRYNALEKRTVQLAALVGDEQATDMMCDIYNAVMQQPIPDNVVKPSPAREQNKDSTQ
jgi:hypothetical protein